MSPPPIDMVSHPAGAEIERLIQALVDSAAREPARAAVLLSAPS